jgi:L-2-hydroxyglutarate oxidase LhgO
MYEMLKGACADVIVVGAGAIGLSVGAECASLGQRVLVLESASKIGQGVSSRGSNVIHSGIYYPEDSLKKQFCIRGQKLLYDYCKRRNIRHRVCGKLVVAAGQDEIAKLQALGSQAERNGVESVKWMDSAGVRQLEPALEVAAALFVPSTGIIDGTQYLASLRDEIQENRGVILLNHKVLKVRHEARNFVVEAQTQCGIIAIGANKLVLAGGLGSHALARCVEDYDLSGTPSPIFVKGSYFRYSGDDRPFEHLVYPVPVRGGLGIHLTMDLSGRIRFGPDVEWLDTTDESRIDFSIDPSRAEQFYSAIRRYWPKLRNGSLIPDHAGVRPALFSPTNAFEDFLIQTPRNHGFKGLVSLFGIESPGLTSSLAIAQHVSAILECEA